MAIADSWGRVMFGFNFATIPANAVINKVTLCYRRENYGSSGDYEYVTAVEISSTVYYSAELGGSTSWTDVEVDWTQNPATSSAWKRSDLDSATFGFEIGSDDYSMPKVSKFWVKVDWDLPTGGGGGAIMF